MLWYIILSLNPLHSVVTHQSSYQAAKYEVT